MPPANAARDTTCNWVICVEADGVWVTVRAALEWFGDAPRDFMRELNDSLRTSVRNDPHLATLDGLYYDLQSVGEFDLALSDRYDMRIQARFVPWSSSASVLGAVAFELGHHTVEIDGAVLKIDGSVYDLPDGNALYMGDGAGLWRIDGSYHALWHGTGPRPVLGWEPASVNVPRLRLFVPTGDHDVTGLLGNANGVPGDDLAFRTGGQLAANPSRQLLHGDYADSWRITNETSLFTYGAGESTETYTDRGFPTIR